MFAADRVQLIFARPVSINRTFDSPEAAIAFLRAMLPAPSAPLGARDAGDGAEKADDARQ
jgi:hypothetical protein